MRVLYILFAMQVLSACTKILDAGLPTDRSTSQMVFANDGTASGAMTGLYYTMSNGGPAGGGEGLSFLCGLSADEYTLLSGNIDEQAVYENRLVAQDMSCWGKFYNYIYQANAVLEGVAASSGLTPAVKQQLKGEALFVRAFCYSYLVNLFGDVPLLTGTDYKTNMQQPRTTIKVVYQQIVQDLVLAKALLSEKYLAANVLTESSERLRPGTWSARALLARVYLYTGEWKLAVREVDSVLVRQDLFAMVALDNVFLKNSQEAIWQLQPVDVDYTPDGYLFNTEKKAACSKSLLQAFDVKDLRKSAWIVKIDTNYYPYKYKSTQGLNGASEYTMVLRLAELYLIRSESKAMLGDKDGALSDLNIIRKRAGLPIYSTNNQEDLLTAISIERRLELFSEWGHRWLDLKRGSGIENVMPDAAKAKGSEWRDFQQWYPIPESEIKADPSLVQNNGY